MAVTLLAFYVFAKYYSPKLLQVRLLLKAVWVLVMLLYLNVFAGIFEVYNLQIASKFDETAPKIVLTSFCTLLFYLLTPFYTPVLPDSRMAILYLFFAITLALLIWRFSYSFFLSSPRFYKTYFLIGSPAEMEIIYNAIANSGINFKIIGFYNTSKTENLPDTLLPIQDYETKGFDINEILAVDDRVAEVIVATNSPENFSEKEVQSLMNLVEKGYTVRSYHQAYEYLTHRLPVQYVGKDFYLYFPFSRSNKNKLYLTFSRLLDVITSLIGLFFFIVLIPFVLLGNVFANRGSLFYKQVRVGKNALPFTILKFRTMVKNAESTGAAWATKDDSRVTPFGKLMRRMRIDEFPQFINVLRGDMSLIGPRPERPEFVDMLKEKIPFYDTRHTIKPGLTGWAQVNERYGASEADSLKKLQYDLYYIKHRSWMLDLGIMIKTITTIIHFRGQ
uniref:exopolysaccharide biosynthesis polyprenyl glycosylphosphotransferase n=1 Tax=Zhouia sp. PK063 TaxID=3373602 RepID=UPI0037DC95EE